MRIRKAGCGADFESILTRGRYIWYTGKEERAWRRPLGLRKEVGEIMLVSFLNSFMSYLMVMLVIVVVAGVATAIGINMAKKKASKNEAVAAIKGSNE